MNKKLDLFILVLFPFLAYFLSSLFKVGALGVVFIFLVLPSVYLSFRNKRAILKSAIFSLAVGIPIIIVVEYFAFASKSWAVLKTSIPFELFGSVAIEAILWAIFLIYFIIMFYEYFLDRKKGSSYLMKYFVFLCFLFLFGFIFLILKAAFSFEVPYFYILFGIFFIFIPIVLFLFKYPKMIFKLLKVGLYFFFFTLVFEIATLKLGIIKYPGSFMGWVNILNFRFPLEELVFWCLLFAMALISYYEFFYDDRA